MLRNFNMVCLLSDVNKIDPNLTFRSSRTPSVCQYKHQSLVMFVAQFPYSQLHDRLSEQDNTRWPAPAEVQVRGRYVYPWMREM